MMETNVKAILHEMFLGEVDMSDQEWQAEYQKYISQMKSKGWSVLPFDQWKETIEDFYAGAEEHLAMPGEDPRAAIARVGKSLDPKGAKS